MEVTNTVTLEWSEVRSDWLAVISGEREPKQPKQRELVKSWRMNRGRQGFYGATVDEMRDWLAHGYRAEAFKSAGQYVPRRKRRRIKYGDDGELDFPLAWSGHDYPFQAWEQRERKPGLRLLVMLSMSCGTRSEIVAQYGAWVAGLIQTFETSGYDLEVSIVNRVSNLHTGARREEVTDTAIRVKREGEASDFTNWSALFSPGGFRILMFNAMCQGADKIGKTLRGDLGYPLGKAWSVEFDRNTRTLTVDSPSTPRECPTEKLSADVRAFGL